MRSYLNDLLARLGLDQAQPLVSSGHLTRCRTRNSPLYRGRVLVAGDAAGLLEPWTREGISYALRSGRMAGRAAAKAPAAASAAEVEAVMAAYAAEVRSALEPEMETGRMLMRAFTRHPRVVHTTMILSPRAWDIFVRTISGQTGFADIARRPLVRLLLRALGSGGKGSLP
jgi:flavin-dependent dehydrogenase